MPSPSATALGSVLATNKARQVALDADEPAIISSVAYGRKDQGYVVDLCDEILGEVGLREHRFAWLRGDPNKRGARAALPVDAYYPRRGLVVEYWELQHDEPSTFFDKRDRLTVSGVHRGEQRARYDRRRQEEIPRHGIGLVIVRARDLACDPSGRLLRDAVHDRRVLSGLLGSTSELPGLTPRPPLQAGYMLADVKKNYANPVVRRIKPSG